jgi:hypothetical protein
MSRALAESRRAVATSISAKKQMDVSRSVVEMVAGDFKTEASKKAVPLDDFMLQH